MISLLLDYICGLIWQAPFDDAISVTLATVGDTIIILLCYLQSL